jgi:hypothetical protein
MSNVLNSDPRSLSFGNKMLSMESYYLESIWEFREILAQHNFKLDKEEKLCYYIVNRYNE